MWILALVPVAAGLGGWWWFNREDTSKVPLATGDGHKVTPVQFKPMVVNPVTGAPVPVNAPTFVSQVQSTGNAVQAAHDLFDYLKAHGYDGSQVLSAYVLDFQKKHNSDPMAKALAGQLIENGKYDLKTSPALSMMIGDVVPADPSAPIPPKPTFGELTDVTKPGAASLAAFNLQVWFKTRKHDKSNPVEKMLVKQFQSDVNTDPKFPGPAYQIKGLPKLVTTPLSVDGDFGPTTQKVYNMLVVS